MLIEKTNFDLIEESVIQELIDAQVPEGLRLDFMIRGHLPLTVVFSEFRSKSQQKT